MKNQLRIKILNKHWLVRKYVDAASYHRAHGIDSLAVTYTNARTLNFHPKGTDLETIVHELVHAYLYELCTHSADLHDDELEEVFAEFMAKFGQECLIQANRIHKLLNK